MHPMNDKNKKIQQMVSDIVEYCRKGNKWGVMSILRTIKENERGALLNICNGDGDTALTVAAAGGHDALMNYLLSIPGVDPNVATKGTQFTPLILAAANGNARVVDRLIKIPELKSEIKDINDMTAAEEALYSGHIGISEMITNSKKP